MDFKPRTDIEFFLLKKLFILEDLFSERYPETSLRYDLRIESEDDLFTGQTYRLVQMSKDGAETKALTGWLSAYHILLWLNGAIKMMDFHDIHLIQHA